MNRNQKIDADNLEENKDILAYIIYEDENGNIVDKSYNNFVIR